MSGDLQCPFCEAEVDGLTLYHAPSGFRLMICPVCYELVRSKERHPYSQAMQRLHRLAGRINQEVVDAEVGMVSGASEDQHGNSLTRRDVPCVF